MSEILLLNGPNLNMLGSREPELYGSLTLEKVVSGVTERVEASGYAVESYQSNAEHLLIERVQTAKEVARFIIINPGALTHTSIGLRDALLSVKIPFIEVHISNIFAREDFRRRSFLSDIAQGCISGLGVSSYIFAADYAVDWLSKSSV
tara:strand:- start:81 stop:527 length:447 start_codon:yes stop_codon:yes gene_type:complete